MELKVYISVLRMCDPGLHSVTGADGAGGESRAWIMTLAGAAVGRVARGAGDLAGTGPRTTPRIPRSRQSGAGPAASIFRGVFFGFFAVHSHSLPFFCYVSVSHRHATGSRTQRRNHT